MSLLQQFQQLWIQTSDGPDVCSFLEAQKAANSGQILAVLLFDQRRRWGSDKPWKVEDYLARLPQLPPGVDWKLQLAIGEFEARKDSHQPLTLGEMSSRFPGLSETLRDRLEKLSAADLTHVGLDKVVSEPDPDDQDDAGRRSIVGPIADSKHQAASVIRPIVDPNLTVLAAQSPEGSSTLTYITSNGIVIGQRGRYRLDRILGEGAFGRVYLGYDEELQRQVAIKVPSKHRLQNIGDAEAYLAEARTVASLDHPHIVPVYDMGRTQDGTVYVVSRFIDGGTLEDRINTGRPPEHESAQIVATVARALQHAHERRLIHRDVKPANILLEGKAGLPYVADFGLAIREEDYLKQTAIAGTPAYMSPEQIRGEGHRLDGRSDIFSLGVVLYELLTEKKPFRGSSVQEMLHLVLTQEPRPPRELQDAIPAELERICLKALSKRASDRYANAADFAEDLEQWLKPATASSPAKAATQVVPKGLRSFDANDADFFLDLLPGQRNRDGLPESIAFWKQRIEQTDPEQTFSVGLIYGPSGCGKSSLVKAGLLPHLSKDVVSVYLEATADETELRILRGLKKHLVAWTFLSESSPPSTAANPNATGNNAHPTAGDDDRRSLTETLLHLRRNGQQKVVIIIDQFEQWLHAHRPDPDCELVKALRQCDGTRVQAILMIRDDFYVAALRLMQALDIEVVPGRNFLLVDLFDVDHARNVLVRFGQAFGKLPANATNLSAEEEQFVSTVASGLAQDGRVVSVRLSLLAEMVKGKPWKPETLEQVGGTQGIGVNFLEETFASIHADPRFRRHSAATRGVLRSLLPDLDTDIKGGMRSHAELLAASGYQDRPTDFNDLLHILDGELRLMTPTDPEGTPNGEPDASSSGSNTSPAGASGAIVVNPPAHAGGSPRCYQLTHDYLVPSLREWLTRKQKETRRGRAELKLAERSALWTAKPENRHLPSLVEWLSIRSRTESKHWTAQQQAMMKRAGGFHLFRSTTVIVLLGLAAVAGFWTWSRVDQNRRVLLAESSKAQEATRIEGLVGRLLSAEPAQVPEIVKELEGNQEVATGYLSPLLSADAKNIDEKRSQLHARLATVAGDKTLVEPLLEELLTNKGPYIGPIREQLRPYAGELTEKLQAILRDDKAEANRRFRAAVALADYIPESEAASWTEQDLQFVAGQLVLENAEFQPLLRENLRPISGRLLPNLEKIFGNATSTDAQRLSAANAFAHYAASDIPKLSELLTVATPAQYAVLYPLVAANPAPSTTEDLGKIAATLPAAELGSVERVPFGQRRANAAVTLLRLGEREKVLPVFEMTDDPEALTQFIFRCRDRGVRVEELLECLRIVSDGAVDRYPRNTRYALLLALGEYALDEIPESRQEILLKQLADWYRNDPSSGVHGAAGWLLRHWRQHDVVRQVDQTAVPYAADREWFTLAITVTPTPPPKPKEEPTEENAAADPGAKTDPESEAAESKDEANEKQDDSASPKSPPEEAKPEPPPEPLPPKTFYYTFIVFPAGDSQIGSFGDEPDRQKDEVRHGVTLTHPFALLDREITFEELIAFAPQYASFMQQLDAKPEDAGFSPHWYDSVAFCRWLSQQSGIAELDQSYADPESLDEKEYAREPNPETNWAPRDWPLELGRRGFRLPTESEWEVASRAGARTAYGYGSDISLLGEFGWFQENSSKHVHPPRELPPTVRGVFDMHGNLFEWTHDWIVDYGEAALVDPVTQKMGSNRVRRGGGWLDVAAYCRSAFRFTYDPSFRAFSSGFRLALSSPSGVSSPAEQRQGK